MTFLFMQKKKERKLDKKAKFNFEIYDVINWETNDYNIHISKYLKK